MDAQAVTVGARLGRRLNAVIVAASKPAADRVSFFGGLLSSIVGAIAGTVGPQTAAELLRIPLARLEGQPQLELPPSVRLAIAAAENNVQPSEPVFGIEEIIAHALDEKLDPRNRLQGVIARLRTLPAEAALTFTPSNEREIPYRATLKFDDETRQVAGIISAQSTIAPVAWMKFAGSGITPSKYPVLCKADELGAFPVYRDAVSATPLFTREDAAKVVERKAQALSENPDNGYVEGDTNAFVWTNKEAEWTAITLEELAEEFRRV